MKIILKNTLKNISSKKARSILIIFSLLIASSVLILNLTIPKQIVETNKLKLRNLIGKTDLLLVNYENKELTEINQNKEPIKSLKVKSTSIINKEKTLQVYGTTIKEANDLELVHSSKLNDGEVIINKTTAKKFNYKVNDTVTITKNNQTYNLKVAKILPNKGLLYFKNYSMILNNKTYDEIFKDDPSTYTTNYIDVLNNKNVTSYKKYIEKNNKNVMIQELVDEEKIEEDNSYISLILIIIFVMATIMIFFVVNTLNKMIVLERTPQIATFRSVGATKKTMNFLLILENATYGLIGGTLGALTSILINNFCIKLLVGTTTQKQVPLTNILAGIIFAIILEIIMSIGAIIKSNKRSVKELLFDNPTSKFTLNKKLSIISIILVITSILLYSLTSDKNSLKNLLQLVALWIGVANIIPLLMSLLSKLISKLTKNTTKGSLILAIKNIGANKLIMSSSRLVVISMSIMLVILNVSSRFNSMLDSFSYQFKGYDIFLRDTTKQETAYNKLYDIKEIKKVDKVYMANSEKTYNHGKLMKTSPIILGMKHERPDIKEYNYKIKDLKEDEALVDEIYLEDNNLKVGDTLKLRMDGYKEEYEFKIVGTVNSFYYSIQREIIVINENYFTKHISNIPFQITVSTDKTSNLDDVISKIERTLKDPDVTIMTVDEFVKDQRANITTIMSLFYIIIGLALGLAFVGIINNQVISFIERTKELAVLNSICMSKSDIKKMLVLENITSNIIACAIGLLVSIMSVKEINAVLNGMSMYIDVTFNMSIALIFIAVVLVILFITVIIPLKKLDKINIVETIKYE